MTELERLREFVNQVRTTLDANWFSGHYDAAAALADIVYELALIDDYQVISGKSAESVPPSAAPSSPDESGLLDPER